MPCLSLSCKEKREFAKLAKQSVECKYDILTIQLWLNKFLDIKADSSALQFNLTFPQLNSFIGYLKSAINYSHNPCYFEVKLDEIALKIQEIDGM